MRKRTLLRPRDNFVPEDFIRSLCQKIKGFRRLKHIVQVRLAYLVWDTDAKYRAHRAWAGYTSYRYTELEALFGRGEFLRLNDKLDLFQITPNWSKKANLTRGFRLKDDVAKIKAQYLKPKKKETLKRLLDLNGRAVRTLPRAIASKVGAAVTVSAWRDVQLPSLIPINLPMAHSLHRRLVRMHAGQPMKDLFMGDYPEKAHAMLEYLEKLLKMAHCDVSGKGFLIHRYFEASTGRLYAQGTSLQTVPREIKKAALHGFYEYDFENCHYSIFDQMTRRFGSEHRAIRHYLTYKKAVRESIASRIGITIEEAKECLIGLMYGAKTTDWSENSIPKLIGPSKANALFKDREFAAIAGDVRQGRAMILKKWATPGRTTLVNDMGKTVSVREDSKVRLAHLIQGVEAKALRRVVQFLEDEIILPMHDGFVTKCRIDRPAVEREIYRETGYSLTVSEEKIRLSSDLGFPKREDTQHVKIAEENDSFPAQLAS